MTADVGDQWAGAALDRGRELACHPRVTDVDQPKSSTSERRAACTGSQLPTGGGDHYIRLATVYLRQGQPEVEHVVSLASPAAETLTGEVDSTRAVSYFTEFIGHLAPYKRRSSVHQVIDQTAELCARA